VCEGTEVARESDSDIEKRENSVRFRRQRENQRKSHRFFPLLESKKARKEEPVKNATWGEKNLVGLAKRCWLRCLGRTFATCLSSMVKEVLVLGPQPTQPTEEQETGGSGISLKME